MGTNSHVSVPFSVIALGVYQAAQNITNTHLNRLCHCIPENIRLELVRLQATKACAGGGKKYWAESTRALGICDTEEGGLRFEKADHPRQNEPP